MIAQYSTETATVDGESRSRWVAFQHARPRRLTAIGRWLTLLASIGISGALVVGVDEPWAGVCSLALLALAATCISGLDILHPYTWYAVPFCLYSVSMPVLIWLEQMSDIGDLQQTVVLEWLALSTLLVVVGPSQVGLVSRTRSRSESAAGGWLLLCGGGFLTALYVERVMTSGLTSKLDLILSDDPLLRLQATFSVLAIAYAVVLAKKLRSGASPWLVMAGGLGWCLIAFLTTGERQVFFRVVWITGALFHVLYRPIPKTLIISAVAAGLLFMPISQDLKNVLIAGAPVALSLDDPLRAIFSNEFKSASQNLQILIHSSNYWSPFLGNTLLWDVRAIFVFGSLFREVAITPTTWYTSFFFPELLSTGEGVGFSLVGEGFMNFGPVGVVLWFAFLGAVIRVLYANSVRGTMWLVTYVVAMPLCVYVTRADLANLLSQLTKHIFAPMVVCVVLEAVFLGSRRWSPK